ncbi:MAG: DegT/DnrJ/EryC1/StrS family aminotransferase, partial [Actinomycetota bacterium]
MAPAGGAAPHRPGLLTGVPRSPERLPVVRPVLPELESIEVDLRQMLRTGILTNAGPFTDAFEAALAERLGLPNPVVLGNGTVAITSPRAGTSASSASMI